MNCPECGSPTEIIDTQKYETVVWRRRRCVKCNYRANTHENFVEDPKTYRTKKEPKPKPEPKPKLVKAEVTPLPVRNTRKQIEDIREYLELRKREREDE